MYNIAIERDFSFTSSEYVQMFVCSAASAFQHPIWLEHLYRLAPAVGARPKTITFRDAINGQLAMVLPLIARDRGLLRILEFADLGVSDYAAPVCAEGALAHIAADARLRIRLRSHLRDCDLIQIKKMLDAHTGLEQLIGRSRRRRLDVRAHSVVLSADFEHWRRTVISASRRSTLDRKRRALQRKGSIRFEELRKPMQIARAFEAMRDFRRPRFHQDRLQQSPFYDFYLRIAVAGAAPGFARTYAIWLDDQLIGALMGLSHKGSFLFLLSGMDYQAHGRQSVGALAFEDLARDCIARGERVLDFTIGDEAYKRDFGARPSPLFTLSAPMTVRGRVADWVAHSRRPRVRPSAADPERAGVLAAISQAAAGFGPRKGALEARH